MSIYNKEKARGVHKEMVNREVLRRRGGVDKEEIRRFSLKDENKEGKGQQPYGYIEVCRSNSKEKRCTHMY